MSMRNVSLSFLYSFFRSELFLPRSVEWSFFSIVIIFPFVSPTSLRVPGQFCPNISFLYHKSNTSETISLWIDTKIAMETRLLEFIPNFDSESDLKSFANDWKIDKSQIKNIANEAIKRWTDSWRCYKLEIHLDWTHRCDVDLFTNYVLRMANTIYSYIYQSYQTFLILL